MELTASEIGKMEAEQQTEQPAEQASARDTRAWLAMVGVALMVMGALAIGQGGLLRLVYPAVAALVGAYLYWKYPVSYFVFAWWVWFLTPFIRRMVDWQSGWVDPSPILLAPVVVSLIAGLGFVRYVLPMAREGGAPFLLAFTGTLYGFGVGLIRTGFDLTLAQPMLVWVVPMFLGFHALLHWRDFPRYRTAVQTTFGAGALVLGLYGIAQFIWAPMWDQFWLQNVGFQSFGQPDPLVIRVFSTLNGSGPFAVVMMACLLMLFSVRGWWKFPAAASGYLAFLLSLVRAAWIGWAVGLCALMLTMNFKARVRLLAVIFVLAASVVPLALLPPFSDVVLPRIQSLTEGKDDLSASARLEGYGKYLNDAVADPLGKGVGAMDRVYSLAPDDDSLGPHDSAILELLLSLGFPGTLFYTVGLLVLLLSLRSINAPGRGDTFVDAARAVTLGMLAQLVFGSVILGVMGAVLWGFAGISLAARRYHAQQKEQLLAAPAAE